MNEFRKYARKGFIEARPYEQGEDLAEVSVSKEDTPKLSGGYIARNPDNHKDKWFISKEFFLKNYDTVKLTGDFRDALRWLQEDLHVSRMAWTNMQIFIIRGRIVDYNTFQSWTNNANKAFNPPKDVVFRDRIDAKLEDGSYLTGWAPTPDDMLASDWYIVR